MGIGNVMFPLNVLFETVAGPWSGEGPQADQTQFPIAMPAANSNWPWMMLSETTTPAKLPLYVFKSSTIFTAPNPDSVVEDMIVFLVTSVPGAPNRTIPPSVEPLI